VIEKRGMLRFEEQISGPIPMHIEGKSRSLVIGPHGNMRANCLGMTSFVAGATVMRKIGDGFAPSQPPQDQRRSGHAFFADVTSRHEKAISRHIPMGGNPAGVAGAAFKARLERAPSAPNEQQIFKSEIGPGAG
jgi:hypothetical protein